MNEANNSRFVAKIWNIANDQSNPNFDVRNGIAYNRSIKI